MSQENLLSSIKNLLSTGASIAQTRLELISVDIEIARSKFIIQLVLIVSTLFFLFLSMVLLALALVIYSWESNRLLALGFLTGSSILIGMILALLTMQSFRRMPKLFETSIAELDKDCEALSK
jgi:uncharacterized membrane protein YqjE